ncbi:MULTISPECIES: ATP-binding protein [unclassified Streptomyces]|uniref:ATP-binding protein n=1 Tax=unclassified Streptomyces TaxID=2593676 RepID=UPI00367A53BD
MRPPHVPPATSASHHRCLAFRSDDRSDAVRPGLTFTRRALADWAPDADTTAVDDVLLVAAELLANAVDHAGGPLALYLRLEPRSARLRIEVSDRVSAEPRVRPLLLDEPRGRGVRIIDRIAADWGSRPEETGKTVWAELHFPAP